MSKIKKLIVQNLKAVTMQQADFNGCTAIITGKNNGGKTSFLRGLFDRLQGVKPEQVLRNGETEGFAEAELTTGEKLRWEFNDKGKGFKEKLTYITEKDIKTPLSVELRNRFAPATFDVDKFLASQPAAQRKVLQDLAGLDFTDIDSRYDAAYKERTAANTRASDAATLANIPMPEKAEPVQVEGLLQRKEAERVRLNNLYVANKNKNTTTRTEWQTKVDTIKEDHRLSCDTEREKARKHNLKVFNQVTDYNKAVSALEVLKAQGYKGDAEAWVKALVVEDEINYEEPVMPELPVEPEYIDELPDNKELVAIDAEIAAASETNNKARTYSDWLLLQDKKTEAGALAKEADKKVKAIEQERMDLIKSANMPEGFAFTDDGISYNGLAFTREQLSSSGIYIAALKLASMKIGEVRTLHFDASFLDNNSLAEIEAWATAQDLQLLIEQPDREGGEITYELIEPA